MKFGLSEAQYEILERLALQPLWAKKATLYVFGSRARGSNQTFSDIDILYVADLAFPISMADIAKVHEDLENSDLTIKVDLVDDTSLAKSYRGSVDKDKILIPPGRAGNSR